MIKEAEKYEFAAKDGTLITIRPAKEDDAIGIVSAVKEIIQTGKYIQKEEPRSIYEEREFIKEMENKSNMYVVVSKDNVIIGIARVVRGELEMKRHVGIFRTWLINEAQGLGIGGMIMDYTLNWCRSRNLHKLCLTVFASNEKAYYVYTKYGFLEEGRQKDQIYLNGVFDDEIYMAVFF